MLLRGLISDFYVADVMTFDAMKINRIQAVSIVVRRLSHILGAVRTMIMQGLVFSSKGSTIPLQGLKLTANIECEAINSQFICRSEVVHESRGESLVKFVMPRGISENRIA